VGHAAVALPGGLGVSLLAVHGWRVSERGILFYSTVIRKRSGGEGENVETSVVCVETVLTP